MASQGQAATGRHPVIVLTPVQSVTIHGWMSPKRTLSWPDIVANDAITIQRIVRDAGVSPEDVRRIQPDVREWVNRKYVSYEVTAGRARSAAPKRMALAAQAPPPAPATASRGWGNSSLTPPAQDVPYMTMYPLDPLDHLHGDVSTLVTQRYPCWMLREIGITYQRLRDRHHLDAKWMKMMGLSLSEWASLGMTVRDVQAMQEAEV